MSYDIFKHYGLDKIKDSMTEESEYKLGSDDWQEVSSKRVKDSDGFMTDYTWYTNGDVHIFMFGDKEIYSPDEDYADWSAETEEEAQNWFDSYRGFDDDSDVWDDFEEDDLDETYTGNYNFMNDGFNRAFDIEGDLED